MIKFIFWITSEAICKEFIKNNNYLNIFCSG